MAKDYRAPPSAPGTDHCAECRFYYPDVDTPNYGWCLRYPPTVVYQAIGARDPTDRETQRYPFLRSDLWCGEFSAAPQATALPA